MERSNTDVMPRCIYSHTALRGIAAASVFLSHLYEEYRTAWHLDPKAFTLFLWSWPAVDLFFMLSGFILCWVYLGRDVSPDWKDYLLARLGRILPLYYLTLIPFLATAPPMLVANMNVADCVPTQTLAQSRGHRCEIL